MFIPRSMLLPTSENVFNDMLMRTSISQLYIIVTEDCNLRCKYCIFSDNYPHTHGYSSQKMTFEIAKKAIDYYLDLYKEKQAYGLGSNPVISFYGGEPLLEFNLIKEIVKYAKELNDNFEFYITTNGTIMNDEIINFLISNSVKITVSLDGYKENHDRNRVFINNKRSFDVIIKNLTKLQEEKEKRGSNQPISFNCCYDNYTDMVKVVDFFSHARLGGAATFYAQISPYDTSYYDHCDDLNKKGFIKENIDTKNQSIKKLLEEYKEKLSKNEKVPEPLKFLFTSMFYIKNAPRGQQGPLGNACIPGSKIAVAPDGNYYLCEKMNETHPIGNVNDGLEWYKIQKIIKDYLEIIEKNCSNCNVKRLCECCYVHLNMNGDGVFKFNKEFCKENKEGIPLMLKTLYSLLEKIPNALSFNDNEKANLSKDFTLLEL
ncbi:hypothetical protein OSSY52_19380 [Tepiditoga spiralis]|uniref:Radical SAM core domain-containing protein n=1 Tax=Tepiditoga spiralis TaxID=2108365 RepID=A0A7G1G9X0_9BACT|nr:radical SAM protein [Tepiditoga spiralis]BBE31797.1 hypothetical protein OSSY52_19380 [Tepiditoga spiralis]